MLIFANNAETTLADPLLALPGDSTDEVEVEVDFATGRWFPNPYTYGDEMHVTLVNPADAPGVHEVVSLIKVDVFGSTAKFTLRRSDDSGMGKPAWTAGTTVSARVTAEMLETFVQAPAGGMFRVHQMDIKNPGSSSRYFAFKTHPVVALNTPWAHPDYGDHFEAREYPAGTELIFRTRNVEIGAAPPHDAGGPYMGGEIVVPGTPDGYQYQFLPLNITGGAMGSVVFPGDGSSVAAYNDDDPPAHVGWWAPTALPIQLVEYLPSRFVLTEVGFLEMGRTGDPTTPPAISIGTSSDNTKYLNNATITGSKRVLVDPDDSFPGNTGLVFTLETPGDDESIVGSFYFKGFRVYGEA